MIPVRLPGLALAAALLLAACGGKDGAGSGDAPPAKVVPSPPAPAKAAPARPAADPIPADGGKVETLPSGLRCSVLKEGTGGEKPRRGDLVTVHYTGWLEDGTVFDSSRKRGDPAQFVVGQLIEGWNEALTRMTPGARWKLTVPAELGYGAAGSPPRIPPGATLVFDVELFAVKAAPAFRRVDAAAAKTTESGLRYQVLEPGAGPAPEETDPVELSFAVWTENGELLRASEFTGQSIQGRKSDMAMPFLKEAPFLLREGGSMIVEVPGEMATKAHPGAKSPPGAMTVWRLRLVRVGKPRPVPAFVLPPDDALQPHPSGLRYQVVKEGTGPSPGPTDEVVVDYAGWLKDGTPFDSSYERGLPATFRLGPGRLIEGWNQGMRTMKAGGTSILVLPPDLGYGARGQGGTIPPNATLVFRIELLEVKK